MTYSLPTAETDYAATLGLRVGRAVWDAVFASIGARLRALELRDTDLDAVIAALQTQALAIISATITEEITARRADLDALTAQTNDLGAQIGQLLATQLPAGNIVVSPSIDGLTATTVQAAIAELLASLTTLSTTTSAALAEKADLAAVYTTVEVDAAIAANATSYATLLKFG